jgi:hypothetical protein
MPAAAQRDGILAASRCGREVVDDGARPLTFLPPFCLPRVLQTCGERECASSIRFAGLWIERSEQTRKQPDEMSDAEIAAILRGKPN